MAFMETTLEESAGRRLAIATIAIEEINAPHLTGEFKTELLRFINRERPDVLVLDWTRIQRAGTDSFGVMLSVKKRLADWEGSLRLCGMNPLLSDGFVQCGLSQLIPLYGDVGSALQADREVP